MTQNTITNNAATQDGGAIYNDAIITENNNTLTGNTLTNNNGTVTVEFNQIVGNTASQGSAIYSTGGTVNATLNWWGSNLGPAPGDVYGNATVTPWLITLTVTSVDPANGTVNVPNNKVITLTFNNPITAGSAFNSINVTRDDGAHAAITKTITGNTLTLTAIYGWSLGRTYTINIPADAVKDQAGDVLQNTYTSNFTIDTPTVISVDPTNGSTNVPNNKVITITFSNPIQAGNAYQYISVTRDDGAQAAITKTITGNTLTISATYGWSLGRTYTINIPADAVKDTTGTPLQTTYTSNFTIIPTSTLALPTHK